MNNILLGDLCEPASKQVKIKPNDLIDYFDISSVDSNSKTVMGYETYKFADAPSRARKKVEKNNIIVSTVRPNLNSVAIFDKETENTPVVSTGFCVLKCKENVSPRYVFNFCRSKSFVDEMVTQATGASYPAVSDSIIRGAHIPDYSKKEQDIITNSLDSISKIKELRQRQLQKLDELVKARFVEMFGDVRTGDYKYETRKLGDVADVGSSHRVFTTEFVESGISFYRGTEIGELANGIKPENPYRITEEHYNRLACDETKPKIGDLLMPSICNKGQVWMVDTEEPFYYKDGRVLCISPNRNLFNCKYLEQFMREKTLVEYPKLGSGSTFAEFKIFLLKDIDVFVPPMELQESFAEFCKQLDKTKSAVQAALDKAQTLFDSLMQKYFG